MDKKNLAKIFGLSIAFSTVVIILATIFKPPGAEDDNPALPSDANAVVQDGEKNAANDAKLAKTSDAVTNTQTDGESPSADNPGADAESQAAQDETLSDNTQQDERKSIKRRFVTIGSLDQKSVDRQLVCLDSKGATVRRVELNSRFDNGDLKYRDVERKGAYLGELELETVELGVKVRLIGNGTPADRAGLQLNDVITLLNDEPVVDAAEFDRVLAKKENRPGKPITLTVVRSPQSTPIQLEVDTSRRPMQVIRPTSVDVLRDMDLLRRGFQLTLQKQTDGIWHDIDREMRLGNWETQLAEDGRSVEFVFDLPVVTIKKDGERIVGAHNDQGTVHGPFQVVKTYRLPNAKGEGAESGRAFHFEMEIEIRNLSLVAQTVNYELSGPTGTPLEGWWYQQKMHGRTWAIGRIAGARDVVTSTPYQSFLFTSGPEIVSNETSRPPRLTPLIDKAASTVDERTVRYLSVDTQYFNVALLPRDEPFTCYSAFAITASQKETITRREQKIRDVTWVMYSNPVELLPYVKGDDTTSYSATFDIFTGPKEPQVLAEYGLDEVRTFGWFAMFSKPLCWLLQFFYSITFQWSYGLAIILLTVLVRSLMIPISRKAALNAQMMQHLQPEIKKIAAKYKDDLEKRGHAQRELFAKYRYNPLGGCLLMFLQLPIFIGLYRGLSVDIALRDQPLIPGVSWCSNLAGPDMFLNWQSWMPSWFSAETGWLGPYLNILPLVTLVLFLVQQKMFMPPAVDDQTKMTQKMMTVMMIVMGFLFFKVPSGLCLYFITSSIWGIMERKLLPKPKLANPPKFGDGSDAGGAEESKQVALPIRDEAQLEERRRRDKERKKKLRNRK